MALTKLSLKQARKLAINCQLLDNKTKLPDGKEGIARTIEHLGYIQIDTISVIERAHHHTLYTRRPDYNENMLHELQAKDRRVFEYWGHAASYLPISDYRYYLPRKKRFLDPYNKWEKERLQKYGHMMAPVLEQITNEGPLCSKDFKLSDSSNRSGWWDWRPTKVALEMLFWQGKLMITERRKFQRVYDLTERVLPDNVDIRYPSNDELGRFVVNRALNAYGVATFKQIKNHLNVALKSEIKRSLDSMIECGEVVTIEIRGIDNSVYYSKPEYLENLTKLRAAKPRVCFLSPFDNFIIQRERVNELFGFNYSIECYVPEPKRKYGYFVLPIFYGDRFAGRLDPKADRKAKTFLVRQLYFEDGFIPDDRFIESFVSGLVMMMRFNKCEIIKLQNVHHPKLKQELVRRIKAAI